MRGTTGIRKHLSDLRQTGCGGNSCIYSNDFSAEKAKNYMGSLSPVGEAEKQKRKRPEINELHPKCWISI